MQGGQRHAVHSQAEQGVGVSARSIGMLRMNAGVLGKEGHRRRSGERGPRRLEACLFEQIGKPDPCPFRVPDRTPHPADSRHSGRNSERPLPEHWRTAGSVTWRTTLQARKAEPGGPIDQAGDLQLPGMEVNRRCAK